MSADSIVFSDVDTTAILFLPSKRVSLQIMRKTYFGQFSAFLETHGILFFFIFIFFKTDIVLKM